MDVESQLLFDVLVMLQLLNLILQERLGQTHPVQRSTLLCESRTLEALTC